jgi:prephenate dehydrogenase
MAIQITILGLGRTGASIGLALAEIKDRARRVGNDREPGVARKAEKLGAVDKIAFNLPSAVREADIVIMALPVDEVQETMKFIAHDLKQGAVLIDTSPVKEAAMGWAKEYLAGKGRYFIGLTPSPNPAILLESGEDVEDARGDLFKNSLMLVSSLPGIDESALDVAAQLVQAMGATPLFSDAVEADGLMAACQIMPRLVSAALVNTTIDQPGWRETRKLAGQVYAQMTGPALYPEESKALGQAALLNAANTVRMLDLLIAELGDIRDAVESRNADTLRERLEHAMKGRAEWLRQRIEANWEKKPGQEVPLPTGGEVLGRLFGIRPRKEKDH